VRTLEDNASKENTLNTQSPQQSHVDVDQKGTGGGSSTVGAVVATHKNTELPQSHAKVEGRSTVGVVVVLLSCEDDGAIGGGGNTQYAQPTW
jgi:hypothetical protein